MAKNQIKQKKTEVIVQKLIEAFKNDFTIEEAVSHAGISKQTYYNWIEEDRSLFDEIESAKTFMNQLAKKNIIKSIKDGNINDSKWHLERRQKQRYSLKQEIETESKVNFQLSSSDIDKMPLEDVIKNLFELINKK